MILDVLISRYLDGELTPEEDAELRSMIAGDVEAKEAFDAAILLHIAMRCEDDTVVPDDVREDTIRAIDIRMSAAPTRKTASRSYRAVAALAVTFLVLCLPFGDTYFNLGSDGVGEFAEQSSAASSPVTTRAGETPRRAAGQLTASNPSSAANSVHNGEIIDTTSFDVVTTDVIGNTNTVESLNSRAEEAVSLDQEGVNTLPVSSLFASADNTPFAPSQPHTSSGPSNSEPSTLATPNLLQSKPVDVLITSSYGQSMTGTVSTEGAVTTISAGVGFAMAKNTFMGLELGTMNYATIREHQIMTRSDDGSAVSARPPMLSSDHVSKLPPTVMPGGTYTTSVYSHAESEGAAWGAAFLQQRLLNLGPAHINGRVAAGVTEDGVLGYGRLGTDIRLFQGVSATIGADASYAPIRQFRQGKMSAQTYGLFLSLTYGIQVRL